MGRRARVSIDEEKVRAALAEAEAAQKELEEDDEDELDIEEDDADLSEMNNPDVQDLEEPPLLGTSPGSSDMFGSSADNVGRATAPPLYGQASNFPTATQFRVWRWENGIPVALGAIDVQASEDDFVTQFYDAMPKPGEQRFQFRLRPIDIRGKEIGKEITINISEHHAALTRIRKRKMMSEDRERNGGGVYVNVPGGGQSPENSQLAEEMGRMFEHAVGSAEERTKLLQEALEEERERLRQEEQRRVEERIRTAENATGVVEKLTDRLMNTDRQRSLEALESQKSAANMMVQTLTTVFSQQQESARQQADRLREADAHRLQQDREFFERQRQELELRRTYEREEAERRRLEEEARLRAELDRREKEMEAKLARERMEADAKREQAKEERERWRQEIEEKRAAEQREWERKQAVEREERDRRAAQEREKWERDRLEMQAQAERLRIELQAAAEKTKMEFEQRREMERQDAERRALLAKDELERARLEFERRRNEERMEAERKAQQAKEEMMAAEARRRDELLLQQKQLEVAAQRDREHAERMMEMARLEREAQREAQATRERMEREAREAAEKDRQRQHDLQVREMELAREKDREHAERMISLSKAQNSGGLSGLTDMLGMETPELLSRIFGGGEEGGGWLEKLPAMIGSLAELGKTALTQKSDGRRVIPVQPVIPTRMAIPQQNPGVSPVPVRPAVETVAAPVVASPSQPQPQPEPTGPYAEALKVDTMKLAKAAGLTLSDIRKSRKAARSLVESLADATDEEGAKRIEGALMGTPVLIMYLAAVSIYGALAEAKSGQELADRIVHTLQANPMVPADLPYTVDDLTRTEQETTPQVVGVNPTPTMGGEA